MPGLPVADFHPTEVEQVLLVELSRSVLGKQFDTAGCVTLL
jgi:hypothetical protein